MAVNDLLFPDDEPDIVRMGGKAHALARLGKQFSIPDWFVVTPDAFHEGDLKENIRDTLQDSLNNLGNGPFAVRSSAVDEDGSDSSFAGQFDSFLNIPANDVEKKIREVWGSAFTESVLEYRKQRKLETAPSAPAVLIQKMVDAEAAGVAFSADPLTHDINKIAVMAVKGLADRLVSGEENGDTYYLDRKGKIVSQDLLGEVAILTDKQKKEVTELALKAEQYFGCPQDIEWAFEGGKLYLLQSRPITTLEKDGETIIWDNSNIVESYSGVTSPLTFSFARRAYTEVYKSFSLLMGVTRKEVADNEHVFSNMLGSIHGHVYYNLLNWYRVLALYPGFTLNRAFMEQMMGVREALPDHMARDIAPPKESLTAKTFDALRLTRTFFRLTGNAFILKYRVEAFYKRLNRVMSDPEPPLEKRNLQELDAYYRTLEQELLTRWYTPIINDFLCMIAFGASQKLLKSWCGEEAGQTIHNDFMIGQGDIISAEPAQRIHRMAELARADETLVAGLIKGDIKILDHNPDLKKEFEDYIAKFGDRCTQELKLESLTLDEDPSSLLQAIGYTAQKAHKPESSNQADPAKQLNEVLKGKPVKKAVAGFWVRWAKARIRDRENLRFERTRVFGRVRKIFLEAGKRLTEEGLIKQERDIFFLQVEEILGLTEGTMTTYDLRSLIELRRKDAENFHAKGDLPNRFETTGAIFPYLMQNELEETVSISLAEGDNRKGLGCCSGVVKAKVRVVHDPRQEALQSGEILVAKHTDPGWIALFSNASGILVERGSLLSHSAIVAREMGIPAIVAIPDIMQWLKTGDIVEMDGAAGTVVKVENE